METANRLTELRSSISLNKVISHSFFPATHVFSTEETQLN